MPDKKISALSSVTSLTGNETFPLVQDGTTKKSSLVQLISALTDLIAPADDDMLLLLDESAAELRSIERSVFLTGYIGPMYSGNDVPGTGNNTLTIGHSRIWNHVAENKTYLMTRTADSVYRRVELTD